MSTNSSRRTKKRLTPRVKVWLETEGRYVFGFGLSEMLRAVERAGSIKHAADRLGKSYRYVWGRIKEAEAALSRPLVETQVGGKGRQRSFLTPAARRLVRHFMTMRDRIIRLAEREFARLFSRLPS